MPLCHHQCQGSGLLVSPSCRNSLQSQLEMRSTFNSVIVPLMTAHCTTGSRDRKLDETCQSPAPAPPYCHRAKEFMTKGKDGKMKDTGVRFADIAGMPGLVFEMREIVKMLLKDPAYMKVGARAPRVSLVILPTVLNTGQEGKSLRYPRESTESKTRRLIGFGSGLYLNG